MPQLDTSTWLITILSMILTLLIVFQLKISKFNYPLSLTLKDINKCPHANPWETKWTKIYSPLSLPQQL
uniref:ATP synthase complex subunit 8 n=1 Tax=Eulemur rubriventer TaxID=34829 RepID=A0A0A7DGC2_EULRU|nr:ATP synthase F0 subunit 8 [Eulemur rubriventer]AII98343.1 ATP synthase F0 subunit 8 [Eulemur rubriventer]AII98382.1 ATP synthase F0 subunit 8 [Eulemur rubriventer]AII98421.1 ATP synthase F0 subunit 8 [Eulemur rubriventer]AII98550.1 ATP synthase F0 subunit 8 [Eulemur rubriventer]AII98845.1 ATP synthase F0 subunit 8 [Eulemur rubriventer]